MKKEYTLRHPVVDGLFYPDSKAELESTIKEYLERIDRPALFERIQEQSGISSPEDRVPIVLIVPHAGYIFSGKVQAFSYSLLENNPVKTAIIIGPAHQKSFKGISVNLDNAYKIPSGLLDVDLAFSNQLVAYSDKISLNEEAHLREHSIEVQLPFIQNVIPGVKIVTILIGEQSWDNSELLKSALIAVMEKLPERYIVIASSDLSHYHAHIEALELDRVLIRDVRKMDPVNFYKNIESGNSEACGFGGILTGIMLANELGDGKSAELFYMDSGEVSGDRNKVVGYLSAALY